MSRRRSTSQLYDLIAALEMRIEHQAAEIAALRNDRPSLTTEGWKEETSTQISRASLLRSGLTAAGAAAATAVGLGMAGSGTADASNGDSVTAGNVTKAERRTAVSYDGTSAYGGVVLLGNDNKIYDGSSASYPAALGGWAGAGSTAGKAGVANGVYGHTDNGDGNAIVGVNSNLVAGGGNGVLGTASSEAGCGVKGTNTRGTAVLGSSASTIGSAAAVAGIMTSTTPGSFSSAVRGQNNGTGEFGIGVWGSQAGNGWGGYFTSAGGIGVYAVGGSGTGVNATGDTAVDAVGETTGIAATSMSGRGIVTSGHSAQIQLTPGAESTHPAVGAPGDIYVDSQSRPWFCRGGTRWELLILGTGPKGQARFSSANSGPTVSTSNRGRGAGLSSSSVKGYGVQCQGGTAPIRLVPAGTSGHPTSGKHQKGELVVDAKGELYICVAGGKPGSWKRMVTK